MNYQAKRRLAIEAGEGPTRVGIVVSAGLLALCLLTLCLLTLCLLSVCGRPKILPKDQLAKVATNVIAQLAGPRGGLQDPDGGGKTETTLHVDLSASMGGYLSGRASRFGRVILTLNDRMGGALTFDALGTPRAGGAQLPPQILAYHLLNQDNYDRGDCDLAAAFQSLCADTNRTHLVLTDSVTTSAKRDDFYQRYSRIAEEANRFLVSGGSLAILLFRSEFDGDYTSVTCMINRPRGKPAEQCLIGYRTCCRPFTLWAFIQRGDSLQRILQALGPELQPERVLEFGTSDIKPKVVEKQSQDGKSRRETIIIRDLRNEYVTGFKPIPIGVLDHRAVNADGFVDLLFDVTVATNSMVHAATVSSASLSAWLKEHMQPELQCWELVRQKGGSYAAQRIQALDVRSAQIQDQPLTPLPSTVSPMPSTVAKLVTAGGVTNPAPVLVGKRDGAASARLVVRVRRPNTKSRIFAWVLTLRLTQSGCDQLIPREFCTRDDSTPKDADKLFEFDVLVSRVLQGGYIPGRLLFITEWR